MSNIEDILSGFRAGHHEFENGHLHSFNGANPYELFESWTKEAVAQEEDEANAFAITTVDESGQPDARIVYLKDIIDGKLVFYTNYNSAKGKAIAHNPKVSMLFFWSKGSRQVRVLGVCTKVPAEISDAYFNSRPRGSQIGAWASDQSDVLTNREVLEDRFKALELKFHEVVPRPPHWGGYWIEPTHFEFWQGRPSRLHDRIIFERSEDQWLLQRLNP